MAVLLAQLPGPINLRLVLSDLKFADILHDLLTAKGNRSGVPRALAVDRNEPRELAGTLHLEGASKDDAIAQIRAINALVTVGTTLTLQSTGATNAVTLKVLPSRGVSQPLDELFELDSGPVLASCAFSFTCEPYAYGPAVTALTTAEFTSPGIIDVGTILGDYSTPLHQEFAWEGDYHVKSLWCGRLKPGSGLTFSNLLFESEGGTWAGGTSGDASAAFAHNALYRVANQVNVWAYKYVSDNALDPGTYIILTRGAVENAIDSGQIGITSNAGVSLGLRSVSITDWGMGEIARAALPNSKVRGTALSRLALSMAVLEGPGGAGRGIMSDYVGFVPASWGYFRILNRDLEYLTVDSDGAVYQNNVASFAGFCGAPITALGPTRLVVFSDAWSGAVPLPAGTISVTYTPRYALWR